MNKRVRGDRSNDLEMQRCQSRTHDRNATGMKLAGRVFSMYLVCSSLRRVNAISVNSRMTVHWYGFMQHRIVQD